MVTAESWMPGDAALPAQAAIAALPSGGTHSAKHCPMPSQEAPHSFSQQRCAGNAVFNHTSQMTELGLREVKRLVQGTQLQGGGASMLTWRSGAVEGHARRGGRIGLKVSVFRQERRCRTASRTGPHVF